MTTELLTLQDAYNRAKANEHFARVAANEAAEYAQKAEKAYARACYEVRQAERALEDAQERGHWCGLRRIWR